MTSFVDRNLNQTAVYWGAPINDGYGGFTWEAPIEISCRWEDSVQEITDMTGMELITQAVVQVAQDLEYNGMLLLGTLDSLDSGGVNDPVAAGAKSIVRFDKVPTLDGEHFYRRAYLYRRAGR